MTPQGKKMSENGAISCVTATHSSSMDLVAVQGASRVHTAPRYRFHALELWLGPWDSCYLRLHPVVAKRVEALDLFSASRCSFILTHNGREVSTMYSCSHTGHFVRYTTPVSIQSPGFLKGQIVQDGVVHVRLRSSWHFRHAVCISTTLTILWRSVFRTHARIAGLMH